MVGDEAIGRPTPVEFLEQLSCGGVPDSFCGSPRRAGMIGAEAKIGVAVGKQRQCRATLSSGHVLLDLDLRSVPWDAKIS